MIFTNEQVQKAYEQGDYSIHADVDASMNYYFTFDENNSPELSHTETNSVGSSVCIYLMDNDTWEEFVYENYDGESDEEIFLNLMNEAINSRLLKEFCSGQYKLYADIKCNDGNVYKKVECDIEFCNGDINKAAIIGLNTNELILKAYIEKIHREPGETEDSIIKVEMPNVNNKSDVELFMKSMFYIIYE